MKSIVHSNVNGKEYEFSCDPNAPLNEVYEAHSQIGAFLLGKIHLANEAMKKEQELPKMDISNEPLQQ